MPFQCHAILAIAFPFQYWFEIQLIKSAKKIFMFLKVSRMYLEFTHFKIGSLTRFAERMKSESTHILVQNVRFEERMNTLSN